MCRVGRTSWLAGYHCTCVFVCLCICLFLYLCILIVVYLCICVSRVWSTSWLAGRHYEAKIVSGHHQRRKIPINGDENDLGRCTDVISSCKS